MSRYRLRPFYPRDAEALILVRNVSPAAIGYGNMLSARHDKPSYVIWIDREPRCGAPRVRGFPILCQRSRATIVGCSRRLNTSDELVSFLSRLSSVILTLVIDDW